jgi:peptidoglycan/LPS O-acetylase OafA/YrhL
MLWIGPTALIMKGGTTPTSELRLTANLGLVIFAGAASFGMIAAMLRFGTVHWPIIDQISENAFGIYFFHYPIVVWVQYALLGISLPAIVKALVVLIGALLLSLAASTAANRVISTVGAVINKGTLVRLKRSDLAREES